MLCFKPLDQIEKTSRNFKKQNYFMIPTNLSFLSSRAKGEYLQNDNFK